MIINAIRYQVIGSSEVYLRFGKTSGAFRNFVSYVGTEQELHDFSAALSFSLTGLPTGKFQQSSINLIDSDGNSWVIDRSSDQAKVFRNRKAVKDALNLGSLYTLLDLDSSEEGETLQPDHVIKPLTLFEKQDELFASIDTNLFDQKQDQNQEPLQTLLDKTITMIRDIRPTLSTLNIKEQEQFLSEIRPYFYEMQQIKKERDALSQSLQNMSRIDSKYLISLKEQIDLIAKIEHIAKDALDPKNSIEYLSNSFKKVDRAINELCSDFGLSTVPSLTKPIPWDKILHHASRLNLYEYLTKASEISLKKMKKSIEPSLKAYYQTVDTFLKNDLQITSELESCLTVLSTQLSQVNPTQLSKTSIIKGYLSKWKNPHNKNKEPSDIEPDPDLSPKNSDSDRLDSSRMAVDYALGRLGELHANLHSAKDSYKEALDQIEDRHEKLVHEYGKLKQNWIKISSAHQLPEKLKINKIMGLIQNQGRLFDLCSQKQNYRQEIISQKKRLKELENLIQSWRKTTNSIKDEPLNNPAVLLSETKSILEYSDKKKKVFSKLEKMQIHYVAQKKIDQILETRTKSVKQLWLRSFQTRKLRSIDIERDDWPLLFKHASLLNLITEQCQRLHPQLKGQEIFNNYSAEMPITIYHWEGQHLSGVAKAKFIKLLKSATSPGLGILLLSDLDLQASLEKIGITTSKKVERKIPEPKKKQAPKAQGKTILSDRAVEALKAFSINPE